MKLSILYGSQTGTAEDLSKRISWDAKRRKVPVWISALDDYPIQNMINETLLLFICSTTGQGEEPDNMKTFWKVIMRRNLPPNSLSHVYFGTIGLGDSSYSKYNFVAKKLQRRLEQLGATPLMPIALGDDQHELGPDAAVDPWLESFWIEVSKQFPELGIPAQPDSETLLSSSYDAQFSTNDKVMHPFPNDHLSSAAVIRNNRITSTDHFQDVRHISIDISTTGLQYSIGDIAIIMPRNPPDAVNDFITLLGLNPDQTFSLVQKDSDNPVPCSFTKSCTVQDCVEKYWDIQSVPRRSFFQLLWHFSDSELEIEKLREFYSATGQEELYTYCNRPKRSIIEVLQDFPETTPNIPFAYLFDLIPAIRPRLFTISSSPIVCPTEVHLLVAVVNYRTRLRKPRLGLCSNYLAECKTGDSIRVGIRRGTFKWPKDSVPIVMVGPGTGCSPFRAYTQDRHARGIGGCYLFFGCRNKKKDFLCQSDWLFWEETGTLQTFTAFSRDQDHKIYVQHKITEQSTLLWRLVNNEGAFIMIAGNAKQMPQGVEDALLEVFQENGLDGEKGRLYLKELESRGRLQYEVWA